MGHGNQILAHASTQTRDTSLYRQLKVKLSASSCNNGVFYRGKYRKSSIKSKWTEI